MKKFAQVRSRGTKKVFPELEGFARMTRDGSLFIQAEGETEDLYVPFNQTRGALDGDFVRAVVTRQPSKGRSCEGKVIEILERSQKRFIGILHTVGAHAWVLMQSRTMPYDIEVDLDEAMDLGAERGMKVAAIVDRWDRGDSCPRGHIVDVLGMPGENDTEMHAILAEFNLPYRFEKEVEAAAKRISSKIGPRELKGRRDFRDVLTFTIDPADAKDFDDALSFKLLDNGNYEVGVHIADVSYYVTPGSPVDDEARLRGTSVYLVDRTVPMLPENLCNNLCSLRAGETKLTFSAVFEMTQDAKIVDKWLGRTIINSDFRLDYEGAQTIIDADPAVASATTDPQRQELESAIRTLNHLAMILKGRRFTAGAIDFDRPEMKVEVDANGHPVNVYQKISKPANWLIEEFMLLANRTVAEYLSGTGRPSVYRIHGEPDAKKLAGLKGFASSFGYKMGDISSDKKAAKALSALLSASKGKAEYMAFENLALRAMAKACYSTENIGHYGLAFDFYTHFTSPIRRYPDLMVHRILASALSKGRKADKNMLEKECDYASSREVIAADAERTSIKYKLVEYMIDKEGKEFNGHISGLTEWGMYVEIEPSHIEGMVPLREIRSDFFTFEEKKYRLVGKRSHRVFKLGDEVRIRVRKANLEQRLLDFDLVENKRKHEYDD